MRRVVNGDVQAWHSLWAAVEPTIWAVSGKWQIVGPLAQSDDDRRNIVVEVMRLLRDAGFRRLRSYLDSSASRPISSFKSWLATVTARAAIDYVRAHPEFSDTRGRPAGERWVRVVPLREREIGPSSADASSRAAIGELLDRARRDLEPDQLRALSLWLEGSSFDEIRIDMSLADAVSADRLVRSSLKRLRDRFHETPDARDDGRESLEETT